MSLLPVQAREMADKIDGVQGNKAKSVLRVEMGEYDNETSSCSAICDLIKNGTKVGGWKRNHS